MPHTLPYIEATILKLLYPYMYIYVLDFFMYMYIQVLLHSVMDGHWQTKQVHVHVSPPQQI